MVDSMNSSNDYRIEISGWGLDNNFFAERTELRWNTDGEKRVQLRRALAEGAIVFVRLLASEPSCGSVPVAYQVREVVPMDCAGYCQITLARLHPRSKESIGTDSASKHIERLERQREAGTGQNERQREEVYQ